MSLKDKLMTLEDFKAVRDVDVASNSAQFTEIKADLGDFGDRVEALETGGGSSLSGDFSTAMITFLSHLTGTFDDEHGQDYIDAVIASLDNSGGGDDPDPSGGDDPDPSGGDDERTLPDAYQAVEYVQADSHQFFETDISAGALPIKIELGIYKTTQASSEQAIVISKYNTNYTGWEIGYSGTANTLFAYSKSSARITNPVVYGNKLDVVARFNTSSPYKQIEVTADGSTVTAEDTGVNDGSAGHTSSHIRFFGATTTANNAACKMYYCKIYNAENELVLDLVPCRLKTSQYGGLYDFVSGTYFQSTTNTHLIPGPDITEGGAA